MSSFCNDNASAPGTPRGQTSYVDADGVQFPKEQKSTSPTNKRSNPVTHPKVDMEAPTPMPEYAPFSPSSKMRPVVGASTRPNYGNQPGIFGLNQSASGPPPGMPNLNNSQTRFNNTFSGRTDGPLPWEAGLQPKASQPGPRSAHGSNRGGASLGSRKAAFIHLRNASKQETATEPPPEAFDQKTNDHLFTRQSLHFVFVKSSYNISLIR